MNKKRTYQVKTVKVIDAPPPGRLHTIYDYFWEQVTPQWDKTPEGKWIAVQLSDVAEARVVYELLKRRNKELRVQRSQHTIYIQKR